MAGHSHFRLPAEEPADFGQRTARAARLALIVGAVGLVLALVLGYKDYFRRFYFSYLTAYGFFLAIVLASQFFVLVQHVSSAGWSVNVRRVAENFAAIAPVMAVLSLPILLSVVLHKGDLYRWALPADPHHVEEAKHEGPAPAAATAAEAMATDAGNQYLAGKTQGDVVDPKSPNVFETHGLEHELDPGRGNRHLDDLILQKRVYLSPLSFILRMMLYFAVWVLIGRYYRGHSLQQDVDGDYRHTSLMQKWSGISLIGLGLTLTFAAFDLFMTLDPHWYSTMFGVYYFATAVVCMFATLIVSIYVMQRLGYLREAVTIEHYHDLGKFLFAFTFFWGYITFSQYMLLWYAAIPEEVTWMSRHGATTLNGAPDIHRQWQPWAVLVLFVCFVIPFPGLLSRHVKRNKKALTFWACWLLVAQFCNMIWIVLPELRLGFDWLSLLTTVVAWVGVGGIVIFFWLRNTAAARIRPVNDPRVFESAAFVNI